MEIEGNVYIADVNDSPFGSLVSNSARSICSISPLIGLLWEGGGTFIY